MRRFFSGFEFLYLCLLCLVFANGVVVADEEFDVQELVDKVKLTSRETEAVALSKEWEGKYRPPVLGESGRIIYHFGESPASIICRANNLTSIELEDGEYIVDGGIFIGDTVNWKVYPVASRRGDSVVTYIVIKPAHNDIETNMMVVTNRRKYDLYLKCTDKGYMTTVAFVYPGIASEQWGNYVNQVSQVVVEEREKREVVVPEGESGSSVVDISNLDFAYKLSGDKPEWLPERIYNDGRKTYIQFPKSVSYSSIPAFTINDGGVNEQVNYRYYNNTYIVDRLFNEGVLVHGVGSTGERVIIKYEG